MLITMQFNDLYSFCVFQEKRKRDAEIENKRRQLEDDRRQLQHLKVKSRNNN